MKKGMFWPVLVCVCMILVSIALLNWGYTAPVYEELSDGLRLAFKIVGFLGAIMVAYVLGAFIAESKFYDEEENEEA